MLGYIAEFKAICQANRVYLLNVADSALKEEAKSQTYLIVPRIFL